MEKTSLKKNDSNHSSTPINISQPNTAEHTNSNRAHSDNKQIVNFSSEIERIYLENTGKNQLADKQLRPESELLRKFVQLHSPDCLVVKMYLHEYSISLERGGVPLDKEVTIQYEEWTLFEHLDTGHLPPYLFNFLSRSDFTIYDGCVIIKLINCRHQKGTPVNVHTSYPDSQTYYVLLRPTPEIIALQTNLLLLQSPNLHTQHPYTVRHRAIQIESCITQKLAPPLCLDTSPDVLLVANFNQFQRFKYNHPRLKRMRRKQANYNTQIQKTAKHLTPSDLRLCDYLNNTACVQTCKKAQKHSLLSSSLKECLLLKSSTSLVTNIAISRPERALENAISLNRQHFKNFVSTSHPPKSMFTRSHSFALPNNSYRSDLQSIIMHGANETRRSSYPMDNSRYMNYTMNNSMHQDSMSQYHTLSASTPGTPPVEPFTPLEDTRYPPMNISENSHFVDNMNLMTTQRNSFHTPSSVTSSEMHIRGNQQASMECIPDSAMSDAYFSRQNSHPSDQDSKQMLPKFSNTFQNKPPTQFVSNTNKFPQKFYPGQPPSYPQASPAPPSYQSTSRIPHNIITPNQSGYGLDSSMRQLTNKRHLDPGNHVPTQAKRFSASAVTSQPPPSLHRHPNNVIRANQSPVRVPANFVSGRKMSQDFYQANQLSPAPFNHTPTQNSNFHTNPVEPSEQ